jgi:uncharacterized protein (TIGR02001 family)
MAMGKLKSLVCVVLLAGAAMPALASTPPADAAAGEDDGDMPHGPLTATVGVATGETFRGVSVPSHDPVFSGNLDYQFQSGFYLGAAAATTNLPGVDAELDLSAGYRDRIGRFSYDLGLVYYTYHGGHRDGPPEPDYGDLNATATYALKFVNLTASASVTPPGLGHSRGAASIATGVEVPFNLTDDISGAVSGTVGLQNQRGSEDYAYWDAGIALYLNWVDFDVRYYATDTRSAQFALRSFHSGHGQWIAQVSRTF